MRQITDALAGLAPFIRLVALLFGAIAAWHALSELLPVLRQVWAPRGTAQSMALVGAALAIIAGQAGK